MTDLIKMGTPARGSKGEKGRERRASFADMKRRPSFCELISADSPLSISDILAAARDTPNLEPRGPYPTYTHAPKHAYSHLPVRRATCPRRRPAPVDLLRASHRRRHRRRRSQVASSGQREGDRSEHGEWDGIRFHNSSVGGRRGCQPHEQDRVLSRRHRHRRRHHADKCGKPSGWLEGCTAPILFWDNDESSLPPLQ